MDMCGRGFIVQDKKVGEKRSYRKVTSTSILPPFRARAANSGAQALRQQGRQIRREARRFVVCDSLI